MQDVFDVFLTDPIQLENDVYSIWLRGHSINEALSIRINVSFDDYLNWFNNDKDRDIQSLIWRDTIDQYRIFESLQRHLTQPPLLHTQLIYQIPPKTLDYMIENYYSFDSSVLRRLLGKKLTTKFRKDLDIISEQTQTPLRSCVRQFDNLRRIFCTVEDRNFQGNICKLIYGLFHLSENLSWEYTCAIFLVHAGFQLHPSNKITNFLTWNDLKFYAALMIKYWISMDNYTKNIISQEDKINNDLEKNPNNNLNNKNDTEILNKQENQYLINKRHISLENPNMINNNFSSSYKRYSSLLVNKSLSNSNGQENDKDNINTNENNNRHTLQLVPDSIDEAWPSVNTIKESMIIEIIRSAEGLELDNRMTSRLRDIKVQLFSDRTSMECFVKKSLDMLAQAYNFLTLSTIEKKMYSIIQGLLTIGASLCQVRESNSFFDDLILMIGQILKEIPLSMTEVDCLFYSIIKSLDSVNSWYLQDDKMRSIYLGDWENYIMVCRTIISSFYERL